MILDSYNDFIEQILSKIKTFGIDVEHLDMDHIGYQASSDDDYDNLKAEFNKIGELVSEEMVNGRRVGIYRLFKPLKYKQYLNTAIELIAPKKDQVCPSALEHVEFVLPQGFDQFLKQYPNVPWNISPINQPKFPMITLKLDDYLQVKFHLTPVLKIIEQSKLNKD